MGWLNEIKSGSIMLPVSYWGLVNNVSVFECYKAHDHISVWHSSILQCQTESGANELARVAVINEQRECVYQTLVKPRNKITNYLTPYVTRR